MIPLGSCTMKLNATTEMEPITWPEFAGIHPFAPARPGRRATLELIDELEHWLAEITGYDAVSLQPNAGSQGEFAGLLAIRGVPRVARRGAPRRLPDPVVGARHQRGVSAAMAGMRVVVVACDDDGNVDLDDLQREGRRARRPARGDHGHLPVDARRVRGGHPRDLRSWCTTPAARCTSTARTSTRWSALARPGEFGARRQPPQPAQDVLHPARRRRSRRRPGRGRGAPGAVPARPPAARRGRPARRRRRSAPRRGARPGILPISVGLRRG